MPFCVFMAVLPDMNRKKTPESYTDRGISYGPSFCEFAIWIEASLQDWSFADYVL